MFALGKAAEQEAWLADPASLPSGNSGTACPASRIFPEHHGSRTFPKHGCLGSSGSTVVPYPQAALSLLQPLRESAKG